MREEFHIFRGFKSFFGGFLSTLKHYDYVELKVAVVVFLPLYSPRSTEDKSLRSVIVDSVQFNRESAIDVHLTTHSFLFKKRNECGIN